MDKTYLAASYRVTQNRDPVPRLPPMSIDYMHVDVEYWFTNATNFKVCGTEGKIISFYRKIVHRKN